MSYWHQRKYDDTRVWAQRVLDVDPKHLLASEFLAGVYWKVEDIAKFVAENLRLAVTFGVPDEALANLKQVTARLDEEFECLDQAISFRDPALVHLAVAPQWDSLRGDPRFAARLEAMRLPA